MASNGHPPLRGDEQGLFVNLSRRLVRSVGRAVSAPETVVEEACAFAWQRLVECQPRRSERIFAWLRTVAIREAWRLARRERVCLRLDEPAREGAMALHELIADRRSSLDVRLEAVAALELVASLPPRQRRLLSLQLAGFSYAETASITGDSLRTVDRQLQRAHRRMREASWAE